MRTSNDDHRPASGVPIRPTAVVLALPNVVPLEVSTICHVLGAEFAIASGAVGPADDTAAGRVVVCGAAAGLVATGSGFGIQVGAGIEALGAANLVVVAGTLPVDPPVGPAVLDALRATHARGVPTVAIGTAAFVLARAGLLDGRRATTHWCHAGALARTYPLVSVDSQEPAVQDGGVCTSAGLNAAVDLCLHLVRLGQDPPDADEAATARVGGDRTAVPRRCVEQPTALAGASGLAEVRDWMVTNLDQPTSVDELAGRAYMSRRQFTRTFRAEAGVSPWQWLLTRRLDQARHLLETTDEPIELIARRCGFPTPLAFRTRFKVEFGTSPSLYRNRCRASADARTEVRAELVGAHRGMS